MSHNFFVVRTFKILLSEETEIKITFRNREFSECYDKMGLSYSEASTIPWYITVKPQSYFSSGRQGINHFEFFPALIYHNGVGYTVVSSNLKISMT